MEIVESLKPDNSCAGEFSVIRIWVLRLMAVYRGHGKLGKVCTTQAFAGAEG
jgi:hypothetical protein